jgi:hypothetical protein
MAVCAGNANGHNFYRKDNLMVDQNAPTSNTARDVLAQVEISGVCRELTGVEPRRCGVGKYRAVATWRGGDGYSVSLDDSKGVWHDPVSDEGGGILDLVKLIRGGNRAEALRWCADLAGIPLDDKPFSAEDRARWAAERRDLERELPDARHWRRAAVSMAQELLDSLKAGLVDPTLPQPGIGELGNLTALLWRLRRIDGAALLAEYAWWRERYPGMTALMIRAAKACGQADRRALMEYLRLTDPQRCAA